MIRSDATAVIAFAASALVAGGLGPRLARPTQSHPPVVVCLGDSITLGITRGGMPAEMDSEGGYPGRVQRRLGSAARVLNRGLGGATAANWTAQPNTPNGRWARVLLRVSHWTDTTFDRAAVWSPKSMEEMILTDARPDIVIILLGINDVSKERAESAADVVGRTVEHLELVSRVAHTTARVVLVSTLLPDRRDPAEIVDAVNARIRARWPDYLPLGERFAAAGGTSLLGDLIHPNEEGYELLSDVIAHELVARDFVHPDAALVAMAGAGLP